MARVRGRGLYPQPSLATFKLARSLLLASSGAVTRFGKESMVMKLRKRMAKWGFVATKAGMATTILAANIG